MNWIVKWQTGILFAIAVDFARCFVAVVAAAAVNVVAVAAGVVVM